MRTLFFMAICLCLSAPTPADTITVCPTGCDFTNISDAANAASDGDVIAISPGEHNIFWGYNKSVTYRGTAGTVVTSGVPSPGGCTWISQSNDVRAIGNCTFEDIEFRWLHQGGIQAGQSSVVFRGCTFRECTAAGTASTCATATSLTFENCLFVDNVHYASNPSPNAFYGGLVVGNASFDRCTFESNCGLVSCYYPAVLEGCIICDHRTGGAAYCMFGRSNSLQLIGCVIANASTETFIEDRDRPYSATGCWLACNRPEAPPSNFWGGAGTLIGCTICNEGCRQLACDALSANDAPCGGDCNTNGTIDVMEVLSGIASDYNANWIPDACECLADLNSDNTVGAADLGLLAAVWGDSATFPMADINHDGSVDANDLGLLLGAWGPCP